MPKNDKGVVKRAIVTPDKHFPLHDQKAINVVCKAIEKVKPDMVDGIAERNSILDSKIEEHLTNDSGSVLYFAEKAREVREKGFQAGNYTEAEKAVIEKEQHKEDFLAGIVAEGDIAIGKQKIEELVAKGQDNGGISKQDGEAYIKKLDEIQKAFTPYNNVGLQR